MSHHTVARAAEHAETIKGSRFVARVEPIEAASDVDALVERSRRAHPDASHHCLAWRVGERYGSDDDGEPGGTAGRPMLDVVLKRDLDHLAIVCVRWFGGTKLGAGGLIRAYGGTTAKALDAAGVRFVADMASVELFIPYAHLDVVHRLLDGWPQLRKGEARFGEGGADLSVELRASDLAALARELADGTRGDVVVRRVDPPPSMNAR